MGGCIDGRGRVGGGSPAHDWTFIPYGTVEGKIEKRCGCGLPRFAATEMTGTSTNTRAGCARVRMALRCVGRQPLPCTAQTRITVQIVITTIVVSSSQARSKSIVNRMLLKSRSSPNPSLASESALCPPNPSSSSITTWTQRLIRSSVEVNLPSYRSLRPSVATITLFATDLSSSRCWTSGTEDT